MPSSTFEVRTLSDRLMEVVRDMILSGTIQPNVAIRQDSLASELNVSKIPLREALVRLEQDGLVVSQPNRGFFVRPMSVAEAEEIYALRLKLEPDASAQSCLAASEAERTAAREVLMRLDAAAAAHQPSAGALNRAFHIALSRPGDHAVTAGIVARMHVMADRYVRKHLEYKGRHLTAEAEHHEILQAWLDRDADRVRKLVAEHLEHTLADLRQEFSLGQAEAPQDQPERQRRAS
ncbi:GntR family transcriptional regulator [Sandaracinobacter sp. RS1-74]|uniref:GntR family transcriptional regulator n=1 Tax=Sandaracinobacteroides sayramensis TaxID=2913411 RepID=UPI001EDC47F6|nr:GntR family transcriptional regulator [Sandaracinobacteroides sayramensis]MCG2840145.1 GntR family transcriptional regulator [Sandaracinobacteroides sayramensis]